MARLRACALDEFISRGMQHVTLGDAPSYVQASVKEMWGQ